MIYFPDDDCDQGLKLNENAVFIQDNYAQVLWVVIDQKLYFFQHVSSMCKESARQLNAVDRISNN